MKHCFSTFKSKDNPNHVSAIVGDLNLQTSTFNFPKHIDNCDEYYDFLGELKKLYDKVDSGDLSDFTEFR